MVWLKTVPIISPRNMNLTWKTKYTSADHKNLKVVTYKLFDDDPTEHWNWYKKKVRYL